MDLTEDEIREILALIEASKFDFFELETGSIKVSVAKNGYRPAHTAPAAAPAAQAHSIPQQPETDTVVGALSPGLIAVESPMVGTFYAGPNPGATPFVEIGAPVEAETTIGLIEVMKVFTAVTAGHAGILAEIQIADGQFVEYGQVLFGIDPVR